MPTVLNDNVLPLTPNSVSASGVQLSPDPAPLVSPQQYAQVTKDTNQNVEDIEEAIADTVEMLCKKCRRTFLYGEYTESQKLYANGMVYPSASPIDVSKTINANVAGTNTIYDPNAPGADPASSIIQGQGVWVGWFSPLPWMPFYTGVVPAQTILTYWGGYTQDTCPADLKRLICKIAYKILNPVNLEGLPTGIQSVSVGGVSMSGHLSAFDVLDPSIKRQIRRWRHPMAYLWQS